MSLGSGSTHVHATKHTYIQTLCYAMFILELRRVKKHCKMQGFWSVGHNFVHPYRLFCTPGPANPLTYKDFEAFYSMTLWKVLKTIGSYNISSLPNPPDEDKIKSNMRPPEGPNWGPKWGHRWNPLGSQKWPIRSRGRPKSGNIRVSLYKNIALYEYRFIPISLYTKNRL